MIFEYEWKVEILVKDIVGKKVFFRARFKQMNDEWGTWKEAEHSPAQIGIGETLTYNFPFTISLPEGAKQS